MSIKEELLSEAFECAVLLWQSHSFKEHPVRTKAMSIPMALR